MRDPGGEEGGCCEGDSGKEVDVEAGWDPTSEEDEEEEDDEDDGEGGEEDEEEGSSLWRMHWMLPRMRRTPPGRDDSILIFLPRSSVLLRCFIASSA